MSKQIQRRLDAARAASVSKYGAEYVNLGGDHYRLNVVPTPSLMLDYKLGIGGFPYGHAVEVFGANKLGKSSAIGYGVLGNVQRQGKLPAIIASEPRMTTPEDKEWGLRLGFDPDLCFIQYPDHAEEAFNMLRDLVFGNQVDYVMIDSLGGLGSKSSAVEDGKKKAYGISGEVSAGLNDIMPRLYKNNIGLLVLNQQRQSGSFNGTILYDSPGGEALKHHMRVRIHLKPGKNRYTANVDGESIVVGRELTCKIIKNNLAQASEKSANFSFYSIATEAYGFGVDTAADIVAVGKITGVITGGTWLSHETFPGGKLQGKAKVGEFLQANPKAMAQVRNEVLAKMVTKELATTAENRETKVTKVATEQDADNE